MFGSGREEDKMVGYLSMLKLGPKLLAWVPGDKAKDLGAWMRSYAYWNQASRQTQPQACVAPAWQRVRHAGHASHLHLHLHLPGCCALCPSAART